MSERYFRIIIGLWLVTGLFLDSAITIAVLIGLLLFEGITNLRVPLVLTRLRYGKEVVSGDSASPPPRFTFEAERALRLIVVIFVSIPLLQNLSLVIPSLASALSGIELDGLQILWWLPWFVGFALIGAGLSGMCPMVMALRYIGLR